MKEDSDYKIRVFSDSVEKDVPHFMGVDVGGTTTNVAVGRLKEGRIRLIFAIQYMSSDIKDIADPIGEAAAFASDNYGADIRSVCVAASGPVEKENSFCQPTKTKWAVDAKKIAKKTGVEHAYVVNDFSAISFGISQLDRSKLKKIKDGAAVKGGAVSVVGPGTGLGKNFLIAGKSKGSYVTVESEGAHCDFQAITDLDWEFARFAAKKNKVRHPSYDMVLTGRGLATIYEFLRKKHDGRQSEVDRKLKNAKDSAEVISANRKKDMLCKKAFKMFSVYLGRVMRNYAIDTLSTGGAYIAGGIAAKNPDAFNKEFIEEFTQSTNHRHILEKMPVWLIKDYDVSLLGACHVAQTIYDQSR